VVLDIDGLLQLRADLSYFLPVAVRAPSGIEASLHGASLSLRGCPRLFGAADNVTLHVCAGLQTGVWLVAQSEPAVRALQARLLAQGLAELRMGVPLFGSARLELGVGPSFSIIRASFYAAYAAGARELLYRVPLVGAQAQLGIVF
jgi:hypothetical protein